MILKWHKLAVGRQPCSTTNSQLMLSQLPLKQDEDEVFCVTAFKKGSNNFRQHFLLQLCSCLMEALINDIILHKDSINKEMMRFRENSVLFKTGSNFPGFSLFHSNFGTYSMLIELQQCCSLAIIFTLCYYVWQKMRVIMVNVINWIEWSSWGSHLSHLFDITYWTHCPTVDRIPPPSCRIEFYS